jgi:hypothetical protein
MSRREAKPLRIQGRNWSVTLMPEESGSHDTVGRESQDAQTIEIKARGLIEDARSIALHESLHAISDCLDIRLEEHQIELLETGLYQLMADNGADWCWLDERIRAAGIVTDRA